MNLINKLTNSIEKSIVLHFDKANGLDSLKEFEFDRPAIGFASDPSQVGISKLSKNMKISLNDL